MRTLLGRASSSRSPLNGSRAFQRRTQPPPRDEPNSNSRTDGRRECDESAPQQRTALAPPRACSPPVSGQDLVDVEFRLVPAADALFVLAREHLADQAEREELEA